MNISKSFQIFSAKEKIVQTLLHDFRLKHEGKRWIGFLQGEGKLSLSPESKGSDKKVLIQFHSEEEWAKNRPIFFVRWLYALRLHYLPFSVLPQLLVLVTFINKSFAFSWRTLAIAFSATVAFHLACNLWNDYEDHVRGVDAPESFGGSGVIQKLWIPAIHLRIAAWGFLLWGVIAGFYLFSQMEWELGGKNLLLLGLLGALGAISYSGWPFRYKYFAMGEFVVFFLSGPVLSMAMATALLKEATPLFYYSVISVPLGLLAVLRLHAGNMQRIPYDNLAEARTLANSIAFPYTKLWHLFILSLCYLTVATLVIFAKIPILCLLVFLSFPLLIQQNLILQKAKGPLDPVLSELRQSAALLQVSFTILYCIGFLF